MLSKYNLKAVVFDDVEAEAKPLIDALNYERIPNIFINFGKDSRDDVKLKNVRLVFADIILGNQKGGDPKAIVEAIKGSIIDNIDETNGPFILIVWSKDTDTLASVLKDRLKEENEKLNFITLELDKNEYFEKDTNTNEWRLQDNKSFEDIKHDINEQLNGLKHLPIFLEWEQDARNTISQLLNEFIEDIADEQKVKNTISSAIKLTLGKKTESSTADKIKSFYQTLNTTLADSIENHSIPIDQHEEFLNGLDLDNIDDDMKADINRKTLFEDPIDNELKTGNIYSFEDFKEKFSDDVVTEICGYNIKKVFDDFFCHIPEDITNDIGTVVDRKCDTFSTSIEDGNLKGKKAFYRKCKDETKNNCYPILLEFTPSCDIAQKKYTKSRLIYGYMIKSNYLCIKPKSDSLYITSFHFKYQDKFRGLDGNYRLAFFIKNIFAVNPNKVKELTPMIRARKEFATDLQHAIANHISRIGISSLDL